ncbi:MAG: hypothetical protein R3A78_08355 [Polyangiales bacterium]
MRLLPPASLLDVLRGRAPLVGSRTDPARPRGYVSPVEPRVLLGIAYGDLAEAEAEYLNHPHGVAEDAGVVVRALLARMQAPRDGAFAPVAHTLWPRASTPSPSRGPSNASSRPNPWAVRAWCTSSIRTH